MLETLARSSLIFSISFLFLSHRYDTSKYDFLLLVTQNTSIEPAMVVEAARHRTSSVSVRKLKFYAAKCTPA